MGMEGKKKRKATKKENRKMRKKEREIIETEKEKEERNCNFFVLIFNDVNEQTISPSYSWTSRLQ